MRQERATMATMAERTDRDAESDDSATPEPYDRFESLTRRLLRVSKDDVREAEARERERRRTA